MIWPNSEGSRTLPRLGEKQGQELMFGREQRSRGWCWRGVLRAKPQIHQREENNNSRSRW